MTLDQQQTAFDVYVEAKAVAESTMTFEAAFEAGQAWVRFLNTFLPPHEQMPLRAAPDSSNVIMFPRQHEAAAG